jgi:hypothetical protein
VTSHSHFQPLGHPTAPKRRCIVAAVLTLAPLIILIPTWRLGGVSALEDDLLYYFPQRVWLAETVRAGHWPFWNPNLALGVPAAADPQIGIWYSFSYLFLILPPFLAYSATIWIHFLLASAGMYRLVRRLTAGWYPALFAALAFELCGFLIAHRAHLTILQAAAWIPWILYAWDRYARSNRRRDFAGAVALFGTQLLVQHMQISMMTGVALVVFLWSHHRKTPGLLTRRFPLGIALSLTFAAIQTIPTALHYAHTTRSDPTFDLFIENSFWPQSLILFCWPMIFGARTPNFYETPYWGPSHWAEQAVYPSLLVLMLTCIAASAWKRDPRVRSWVVLVAIGLFFALGRFNPLTYPFSFVPILGSFRVPARWIVLLAVAMPVLAALAIENLLSTDRHAWHPRLKAVAVYIFGPIMLITIGAAILLARIGHTPWKSIAPIDVHFTSTQPAIAVPIILAFMTLWSLLRLLHPERRSTGPYLLVVLFFDLGSVAAFIDIDQKTYPNRQALLTSPLADHLNNHRDPNRPDRLWCPRDQPDIRRPTDALWPNVNLLHNIPTLNAYSPLMSRNHRAMLRMQPWGASDDAVELLRRPDVLRELGVRWIVAATDADRQLIQRARMASAITAQPILKALPNGLDVPSKSPYRHPIGPLQPGPYELSLNAIPFRPNAGTRWYVQLLDDQARPITARRHAEPADFMTPIRRFRFHLDVDHPVKQAVIHVAAFRSKGIRISDLTLAPLIPPTAPLGDPIHIETEEHPIELIELPDSQPLISFAKRIVSMGRNPSDALDFIWFDPAASPIDNLAVILENTQDIPTESSGTIRQTNRTPSRITADLSTETGGFLIIRDAFAPGWTATLDNQPTPILPTNVLLKGLPIPPGNHRLVLTYRPPGLILGAALTAVTPLVLFAFACVPQRRHRVTPAC